MASPQVANQTFPNFRTALNAIITSLDTVKAGSSAPTNYQAYTSWLDTSASPPILKIRNGANSAWINIMQYLGADASEADWFIDEDSFTTNSAVLVPSQQSVKAYVDAQIAGVSGGGASVASIILEDQKASATNGGTFTSGSWVTRTINTEVSDPNGRCTISSNQITLSAGSYGILRASAPASDVGYHQIALYDITGSSYLKYGTTEYAPSSPYVTKSVLCHNIGTLGSSRVFEIRHRCQTSETGGSGLGKAHSFGNVNVYTQVTIEDFN